MSTYLNSILLEGEVVSEVKMKVRHGSSPAVFTIRTEDQGNFFEVTIYTDDYRGVARQLADTGILYNRNVRVVGKLTESAETGAIMVAAEHIEVRPKSKLS